MHLLSMSIDYVLLEGEKKIVKCTLLCQSSRCSHLVLQLPDHLGIPHWTCSSMGMSVSCWGAQARTCSRARAVALTVPKWNWNNFPWESHM